MGRYRGIHMDSACGKPTIYADLPKVKHIVSGYVLTGGPEMNAFPPSAPKQHLGSHPYCTPCPWPQWLRRGRPATSPRGGRGFQQVSGHLCSPGAQIRPLDEDEGGMGRGSRN